MGLFKTKEAPKIRLEYALAQYHEINMPSNEENKREILSKYNGRQVLVKDLHYTSDKTNFIVGGVLNFNPEDPEVYELLYDTQEKQDEKLRFHVNDLEMLLVKIK